jgi:hypothetical protein
MSKKKSKGKNQKVKKGRSAKVLNFREFKDKCRPKKESGTPGYTLEDLEKRAKELLDATDAIKAAGCTDKFDIEAIKKKVEETRPKPDPSKTFAPLTVKEVVKKKVQEFLLNLIIV